MNETTKEANKEISKLKLFECHRCKKKVSAIWRVTLLRVTVEICDTCKSELQDQIIDYIKDKAFDQFITKSENKK